MSSDHPPLGYKDVIRGLKKLGFEKRPGKATSHEQWSKIDRDRLFKVTVDRSKEPFGHDLIKSMVAQGGVSKKEFYRACLD